MRARGAFRKHAHAHCSAPSPPPLPGGGGKWRLAAGWIKRWGKVESSVTGDSRVRSGCLRNILNRMALEPGLPEEFLCFGNRKYLQSLPGEAEWGKIPRTVKTNAWKTQTQLGKTNRQTKNFNSLTSWVMSSKKLPGAWFYNLGPDGQDLSHIRISLRSVGKESCNC